MCWILCGMKRLKERTSKTTLPAETTVAGALMSMIGQLEFVEPLAHGENGECIGMDRNGGLVGFDIHEPEDNFPRHVDGGRLKDQRGDSARWSKSNGCRVPIQE